MISNCPHIKCRVSFLLKALSVSQPCLFSPPLSQVFGCLVLSMTMYESVAASFASPLPRKRLHSCVSDKDKGSSESKKCVKIFETKEFRTSMRPGTTFQVYTAHKANFRVAGRPGVKGCAAKRRHGPDPGS